MSLSFLFFSFFISERRVPVNGHSHDNLNALGGCLPQLEGKCSKILQYLLKVLELQERGPMPTHTSIDDLGQ
jgi:hypothetical protein